MSLDGKRLNTIFISSPERKILLDFYCCYVFFISPVLSSRNGSLCALKCYFSGTSKTITFIVMINWIMRISFQHINFLLFRHTSSTSPNCCKRNLLPHRVGKFIGSESAKRLHKENFNCAIEPSSQGFETFSPPRNFSGRIYWQ